MAEVTRVLREVQLNAEAGLVPARGSAPLYSSRASKVVKDDSAIVGATKAARKVAVPRNKSFVGVTNAELANKKAASWSDFGLTKPSAGNKEAAGSTTADIGVTEADAAGGVKEASGKGVVTEAAWIEFVFPKTPAELLERKIEPTATLITREMVPDVIIERLQKKLPFQKLPPVKKGGVYDEYPKLRESYLSTMSNWNYLVDLHADVLRQVEEKRYAEVGVDFTDGVKKIFILPRPQGCAA